ncbi:MAG TPA: choice-of-anchor D domain-containing protein, partial [Thermoanaerobaculia bacterium]|nr:choice-of-anchor D domain-containing protein [Thermoanaerobaculia bacterium]
PAGQADSRRFNITNTGNANLNITNAASLVSGTGWSLIETPVTPIAPGTTSYFRVRIQSATAGTFTGTVSIASDDPNDSPYAFSVQATVNPPPAPNITVAQNWDGANVAKGATITYTPNVPAGQADSRRFNITNTGNANLNITNAASLVSGTGWSLIETPVTPIAPGATSYFRVRIQSATAGTFTGTVSIASDDPNDSPYSFTVRATVDAPLIPAIAVSQNWDGANVAKGATITFTPNVPAGQADSRRFNITNTGNTNLNITNAASLVSGTGWSLIETPVTPIPPGGTSYFRARILSSTGGTFTGTVSIASDDPNDNPYTFSVRATVDPPPQPEIRVFRDWDNVELTSGAGFVFPELAPGVPDSRQFRIENQGPGTLTLTNPSSLVAGACFSQIGDPPATSLAQGASTLFRVRLQCATGGIYAGTVSIASNDGDENPFTLNLSGRVGNLPPMRITAPDGSLVGTGSTFVFPETGIAVPVSRLFTIWNDGATDLTLAAPTGLVTGSGWSQIDDPPSTTIPAGGSTTFRIRLHSATAGAYTGLATVETTDPAQLPYRFNLTGEVGVPDFTVSVSPAQRNLLPGENVGYTLSVAGRYGFSTPVTLSVTGLPTSSSATWTPLSIYPGSSSALRVFTSGTTPVGLHTLTLTGTSGSLSHSVPVTLNVRSATDFTLQVNPSLVSTSPGGTAVYQVSVSADTAVAGGVDLDVDGLPKGFTASFDPPNVQVGETSTLTVTTSALATLDTYSFLILGSGGGISRETTAQLRVASAEKPVLDSISPDSFGSGGRTRVIVQGSFLTGATVSIAEEQPDPENPISRFFPTAQVISIGPGGTSMEVEIDATDTRILDFYNLVVDNGSGMEAIQFRVLPGGPLVDAWTPSQPQVDRIHALSIAGRNLAGTTVTASVGGRILLHSVETSESEITALLEVLPNAPTGPMDLIVSDAQGRTVNVPITIVLPQQSSLASRNLTESKNGEKVAGGYRQQPAIWFQEFTIRDPDRTEVVPEGLRIEGIDQETYLAERSNKAISFELYIRITIPLVRVQWQKVILFDPITGAIGDAVLQALGVGARVPIGAFVISAYFQMDLTIYFRLTNTGFTFPRFCIEITYGIEITGFDGFAYNRSFCVGGGWNAFGTGSVSGGEITGGECASVTPVGLDDGLLEGMVEQNACCAQPIGVAMSGHTFTGLSWGRSFSVSNPAAGTTTPANPVCNCTVDLHPAVVRPGFQVSMNAFITNNSDQPATYTWTLARTSGNTDILLPQNPGSVQLAARQTLGIQIPIGFPTGLPAPDVPEVQFSVTDGSCQAAKTSTVCVYPTGESSGFEGWWAAEPSDVALFMGNLEPATTSFQGRRVFESVPGTASFDNCKQRVPLSPFPDYSTNNLSGGNWNIVANNQYHERDLIGMKCTSPPNQVCDFDGYYLTALPGGCEAGTTQTMNIVCTDVNGQVTQKDYAQNVVRIEAKPGGTVIKRDNAVSNSH